MLVFFILVNLISNAIENKLKMLIDKRFNINLDISEISMDNCKNFNKDSFYYRGRPANIKDIIDSNKTNDLNKYEIVYIPELTYFQNVTLFPKSTIFLYHLFYRQSFNQSYKDYCLIDINNFLIHIIFIILLLAKLLMKIKKN